MHVIDVDESDVPAGVHSEVPTRMVLRLLGVRKLEPTSRYVHGFDSGSESMTTTPVSCEVRAVSYVYVHGDAVQVAATPRTLSTTLAVVLLEVELAAPVTQLTCDTLVEYTAQRTPPIVTSMSPRRPLRPSPYRLTIVPPATDPPLGSNERSWLEYEIVAELSDGDKPRLSTPAVMTCGAKASRCGRRHVRMTRVCISRVHEVTGQLTGVYAASFVAVSTSHGCPPTVTLFSDGVRESAWPVTVRTLPSLPLVGEVAVSTGVSGSEYEKRQPQPPVTAHAATCTPESKIDVGRTSVTGGGGGDDGGGG